MILNPHKTVSKKSFSLDMGDKKVQFSSSTTHLGLLRSEVNENIIKIEERLSLARRTLYALINTGVHGSNGLNPRVSYKIYQCYVIPRLLYGLEVLPLTQTQINILSKFHLDNLKRFQSLPIRVATCAVYLLLGALPLEAELHKRQLGLLYNILISDNETVKELTERQIALNLDNRLNYYSKVQDLLDQYQLPPLKDLKSCLTTKENWKFQIRTAIYNYWSDELKREACDKSTLCYMDIDSARIGLTLICCKLVNKFSNATVCARCKCCGLADEDLSHILLDCPALFSQRNLFYPKVRSLTINYIGIDLWKKIFNSQPNVVRLLLDCTIFPVFKCESQIKEISKASKELCYRLHLKRIHKMKDM